MPDQPDPQSGYEPPEAEEISSDGEPVSTAPLNTAG
jgi:hypothetical protein